MTDATARTVKIGDTIRLTASNKPAKVMAKHDTGWSVIFDVVVDGAWQRAPMAAVEC